MHSPHNIYIKGVLSDSSSVLMAEAAALALALSASTAGHKLLTDNQELVCFFSSTNHSKPPDWRIKHLTRHFIICLQRQNHRIFKIGRHLNQTAHTLAKQAFLDIQSHHASPSFTCTNSDHANQCPLMEALQHVLIDSVSLPTARCC